MVWSKGDPPAGDLLGAIQKAGFEGRVLNSPAPGRSVDDGDKTRRHLIVMGGGSAAFAAAIRASDLGARVTIINDGLPIGGTCVNVGCVPSKTLLRAAEAHHRAAHHNFKGIDSKSRVSDFSAIMAQKKSLVGKLRTSKYEDVVAGLPNVTIIPGRARLISPTAAQVNGQRIEGDGILIATGARPGVPAIPNLEKSGYLTNETAYELEELPESLIVLGGRYVGLETAQMFARLGSRVTVLQRSERILPTESSDLTQALTGFLREEGISVLTGVSVRRVLRAGDTVKVEASIEGRDQSFEATHLLVATGRSPNTKDTGLESLNMSLDPGGFIKVSESLETSVGGIYAAGDVIGQPMFVYTAAYEGALAAENALTGKKTPRDYTALPWVLFTDPQVAGVGMDERQAAEQGVDAESRSLTLDLVSRSLAARDTRGFIKLIRNRETDRLVGARILAPEGAELLMEISLAIKFGITVEQIARSFHPYLTLFEGIKLAAISFKKDVGKLSCCAA